MYLIGYAIKFTPNCCNGFLCGFCQALLFPHRSALVAVHKQWQTSKIHKAFYHQKFCRHKPCGKPQESQSIWEMLPLSWKEGASCQYHHCKEWHDKPCHLRKGYGKRKSKIIDQNTVPFPQTRYWYSFVFSSCNQSFHKNRVADWATPCKIEKSASSNVPTDFNRRFQNPMIGWDKRS